MRRILSVLFFFALPAPVILLLIFRFLPIPFTPQMAIHLVTLNPVHHSWREMSAISPYLQRAVIGSEDQNFCNHHGFDWKEMDDAWNDYTKRHKPLRGASTLSQQTARDYRTTANYLQNLNAEGWTAVADRQAARLARRTGRTVEERDPAPALAFFAESDAAFFASAFAVESRTSESAVTWS